MKNKFLEFAKTQSPFSFPMDKSGKGLFEADGEGAFVEWWTPRDGNVGDDPQVDEQRAKALIACAVSLENSQAEIHEMNLYNGQQYSNRQVAFFDWGTNQFVRQSNKPISRVNENMTAVIIDAMTAQIGKNRPKATAITRGASWSVRKNAKRLDKYLWGETMRQVLYDKFKSTFKTACIYGVGGMRHEWIKGKDELTEVFPDDILVDEREAAATGDFSYIMHRRCLPLNVVAAKFGIDPQVLKRDATFIDNPVANRRIGNGWVLVVEGWLKANDGHKGRYVAATNGRLLRDEVWDHKWVPFVFFRYNAPVAGRGFFTPSLVETILPFQIRHNELSDAIRFGIDSAGPVWMVPEGSRVNPNDLLGRYHRAIRHTPNLPPSLTIIPVGDGVLFEERRRVWEDAFQRVGLNQSSNASLPAAVRYDSSPALQEANAIQDDRLVDPAQRYEEYILANFKMMAQVTAANATADTTTVWTYAGRKKSMRMTEQIKWKDINLEENSYVLQLEASSAHSMTPAAARQRLEEDLGKGAITPEEYALNTMHPDSESTATLASVQAEDLEWVVEQLQEGLYPPPESEQDLAGGIPRVRLSLLQLNQYDDVPEEVREVHVTWIAAASAIVEKAAEADAQGAPVGPDMAPGAMPPPEDPFAAMQGPAGGPGQLQGMAPGPQGPAMSPIPLPQLGQ